MTACSCSDLARRDPGAAPPARDCGAGSPLRRLRLPAEADDECIVSLADGLIDRRVRALAVGLDGTYAAGQPRD